MVDRLLAKARQALMTAGRDLDAGDHDASVNRSYYAAFYAAWAMLAARGIDKPKTHSGMIAEFSKRFVKDGPLDRTTGTTLSKLENLRSYADYTLLETPREKAELAWQSAQSFVRVVEEALKSETSTQGSVQE